MDRVDKLTREAAEAVFYGFGRDPDILQAPPETVKEQMASSLRPHIAALVEEAEGWKERSERSEDNELAAVQRAEEAEAKLAAVTAERDDLSQQLKRALSEDTEDSDGTYEAELIAVAMALPAHMTASLNRIITLVAAEAARIAGRVSEDAAREIRIAFTEREPRQ